KPSVAPVDMTGTTGTPGHMSVVARSTAAMISGFSGEGSLAAASSIGATEIFESAITRTKVERTSAGDSTGRIQQLTTGHAVCGSALSACPPSRRVATQVVRRSALSRGDFESRFRAPRSGGTLDTARISDAREPSASADILL